MTCPRLFPGVLLRRLYVSQQEEIIDRIPIASDSVDELDHYELSALMLLLFDIYDAILD